MPLGRDERDRRDRHQERDRRELLGGVRGDRDEAVQHVGRRRQEERAAKDGLDRVQLELEAGDDAEVAAAPADRPEEVRMVVRIGRDQTTIGRHDLDGLQRVDGEAVLADEEADTAAERQAGDADGAGVAERGGKAVRRGRCRVLARGQAGLGPRRSSLGIDMEPLHAREIEHDPVIDSAVAGDAVAAAPHRELHARVPCQDHGPCHVARTGGLHDERGPAVIDRVVGVSGGVVVGAAGEDQLALEFGSEGRQVERVQEIVAARAKRFQGRAP